MSERSLVFSPEHEVLRQSIRRWLTENVVPHHAAWDQAGIVPRDIWRAFGEQGFLCPWVPEEYGGMAADFLSTVVILEELRRAEARGLNVSLHADITAPYLMHYGTEEQKRKFLPGVVSGDIVLAIGMTEPGVGSDLAQVATTARRDGDHYVVNGSKTFITNGQLADLVVVVVRTSSGDGKPHRGVSLLLVEADTPGFARGRNLDKLGLHAQDTSELHFDDCRVPVANLLGEEGRGFYQLMEQLQQERLVVALEAQVDAEVALQHTVQYVQDRKAFGAPLAKLQHVQFEIAEMATHVELGRTFIDRLIADHAAGRSREQEVSMAKWWVTDMCFDVCDRCLQLHGGYGYMMEYPIARLWQDVRVQRIYAGSNEVMKQIVAKRILTQ